MKKTVPFKMPPKPADPMESWVANRASNAPVHESTAVMQLPQPAEVMKRFTVDVTEELHRRIKAQCAVRGAKMADVIRDILEREFPKTPA